MKSENEAVFLPADNVACVKNDFHNNALTIGKHYKVISVRYWNPTVKQYITELEITNDFGFKFFYKAECFKVVKPLLLTKDGKEKKLFEVKMKVRATDKEDAALVLEILVEQSLYYDSPKLSEIFEFEEVEAKSGVNESEPKTSGLAPQESSAT